MSDLVERLRQFEVSDSLGDGDFKVCYEAAAAIERLTAERDRLATDAERYRWLRGDQLRFVVGTEPGMYANTFTAWLSGPEMDAAIDAALQEERDESQ